MINLRGATIYVQPSPRTFALEDHLRTFGARVISALDTEEVASVSLAILKCLPLGLDGVSPEAQLEVDRLFNSALAEFEGSVPIILIVPAEIYAVEQQLEWIACAPFTCYARHETQPPSDLVGWFTGIYYNSFLVAVAELLGINQG